MSASTKPTTKGIQFVTNGGKHTLCPEKGTPFN